METNRYLVKVNDNEEAFKLLKKMRAKSNIKWASGDELDNEFIFHTVCNVDDDVSYLVIRGNVACWLDEATYFQAPEEFALFDLYDVNSFIEEVVNNMTKKLEIKDIAIITSDDKYGEKLLSFLDEFTAVKFNSGDSLTSKLVFEAIKYLKDESPNGNLVFIIRDNRAYFEMYDEEVEELYMMLGIDIVYDSVRDFLLDRDKWIKE